MAALSALGDVFEPFELEWFEFEWFNFCSLHMKFLAVLLLLAVIGSAGDYSLNIRRSDGRRGPPATTTTTQKRSTFTTGYFVITLPQRLSDDALALVRQGIEHDYTPIATAQHVTVTGCSVTSELRVRIRTLLTVECTFTGSTISAAARKAFMASLVQHVLDATPSTGINTATAAVTVDEDQAVQLKLPDPPIVLAPENETTPTTGSTARRKRSLVKPVTSSLPPYGELSPPWALDAIDQRTTNYDQIYSYWGNATGMTGYVIDTGVDPTHAEFQGRVVALANTIDGSGPLDCNGHGTHVTGLMTGLYVGVAKGAHVRVIKALDCDGSGSTSSIVAALWLIDDDAINGRPGDPNSPFVINLSLNGPMSQSLTDALQTLLAAHHVIIVAAAGNAGSGACNTAPAAVSGVLAIGATTQSMQRASFSNYGSCVPRYAPGVGIVSTWPNGQYAIASGTSMAAPIEAGADLVVMGQMMDSGYTLGNTNIRTPVLSVMHLQATSSSSIDKPFLFASFDASAANNYGVTPPPPPPAPAPPGPQPPPPPPANPPALIVAPPVVRRTSGASGMHTYTRPSRLIGTRLAFMLLVLTLVQIHGIVGHRR